MEKTRTKTKKPSPVNLKKRYFPEIEEFNRGVLTVHQIEIKMEKVS